MRFEKAMQDEPYVPKPVNNRRLTKSRKVTYLKELSEVQSVPLYDKKTKNLLGYRYVSHDKIELPIEPKKSVRKVVIPKGCSVYKFDNGFSCIALNKKNADRKYLSSFK